MSQVRFFVEGHPRPAGSKRAFIRKRADGRLGVGVADMSGAHGKVWRKTVAWFARQAYDGPPLSGPLRLVVTFVMPRPQNHFGKHGLRPNARPWPTVAPDATKLVRALEDACNGLVWHDDAQIVEQVVRKEYGERVGAQVAVELVSA